MIPEATGSEGTMVAGLGVLLVAAVAGMGHFARQGWRKSGSLERGLLLGLTGLACLVAGGMGLVAGGWFVQLRVVAVAADQLVRFAGMLGVDSSILAVLVAMFAVVVSVVAVGIQVRQAARNRLWNILLRHIDSCRASTQIPFWRECGCVKGGPWLSDYAHYTLTRKTSSVALNAAACLQVLDLLLGKLQKLCMAVLNREAFSPE